jgi:CheY-like chemotaxis protein
MTDRSHSVRPAVLVVEDEFWVMQDVAETLAEHGYEGLCARNGDEALPLLESRPDVKVVFTDVNMPGRVDGLSLAREVSRRWPWIDVLITSGRVREGDIDLQPEWPFTPKPYDPKKVVRRIRHARRRGWQAMITASSGGRPSPTRRRRSGTR